MNWITDFVKPKLSALIRRKDIPDNLWVKCSKCEQMIFHRIFEENYNVCNHCQNHMYLPVEKRFELLFDNGEYTVLDAPEVPQDPLHFKDLKKYTDRLKQYKYKTGHQDAAVSARGHIGDRSAVIYNMDFSFLGGSMGGYVGETFVAAAKEAIQTKSAFIAVTASGGARMQEAVYSLMQMPKTTVAVEMLKEHKLPYIVVLANPTMGGVTASFAMLGDVSIAEPGALIGFAGPRVIEQTIRQKLPDNFQTAEYLLDHGMIDAVIPRMELKEKLSQVIKILS